MPTAAKTALTGRRILFVGIGFYDYERVIVERLRARGAHVTAFESPPAALRSGPWAGLLRPWPGIVRRLAQRHEAMLLAAVGQTPFDQVLVIKGTNLGLGFLSALRERLPRAEFVLYLWDSLARLDGIAPRRRLFDRVLSFDRQDCLRDAGLAFRPLFFREHGPAGGAGSTVTDIDLSFVGWLHSDRLQAVREAEDAARKDGLRTEIYLFTGWLTWLRLALRGQARGVHVRPMPYEQLLALNRRSRCVLDLPHAAQDGLTMRAIEALGAGVKLATSGTDIVRYDFHSPANVALVDAQRPRVDPTFVVGPQVPVTDAIRQRYGLDAWIDDVLLGDAAAARTTTPPKRAGAAPDNPAVADASIARS